MDRVIIMPHGERQALTKSLGCSNSLMTQALRFKINSELAYRIRIAAMNWHRGIYMKDGMF